ncbi:hypothetical protein [Cryobacterium fucosi]|uniref:Type II toxin-antitoxin system PemK/MazF family toxin n=1 Tax=Cryobacterium fucosi TaxID=1259157 RepID=A0A4R9B2Y4_9MICO|nr:hypothetical protein [Cryobacterium fucosi]TFD74492.1 hypothetical protein E3T48_13300 [Cryobacterium fucosi]
MKAVQSVATLRSVEEWLARIWNCPLWDAHPTCGRVPDVAAPLLRMLLPADGITGLDAVSFVLVDKTTTVRRTSVTQRIGRLSSTQLVEHERLVMVFLGLAD